MKQIKSWTRWLYWFTFAVAVVFIYKMLDNFTEITGAIGNFLSVLMPFIIGILIAYLLYIPVRKIEETYKKNKVLKKRARGLSILTVYFILVLFIVFVVNIIFPMLSKSIMDLGSQLPTYYQKTIEFVEDLPDDETIIGKQSIKEMIANLQQIDITKILNLKNITDYIGKAVGIVKGIFSIFVSVIMSVYILLERETILKFFKKMNKALFKKNTAVSLDKYFEKTNEIFFKFISSQILDAIIVGVITSIGMSILGVKYAVLLGVMIGVFNIIPYFGAIVAVIIAVVITIFTGGVTQAIWMAVVVIILQQIDANIINPRIIGNALKLSPILVIFSVTVGGAYGGVLGMFLAVPIIAILKLLVNDYIDYRTALKEKKEGI